MTNNHVTNSDDSVILNMLYAGNFATTFNTNNMNTPDINELLSGVLSPPHDFLWVTFDYERLIDLQEKGYTYFVFVVEDEEKKIYPFKTYYEAVDKKLENTDLDIQDNYIMCDDYALIEIAKGDSMSNVMVQITV